MKLAVITDDGKTISQHFGRAVYYAILAVEDGQVVQKYVGVQNQEILLEAVNQAGA